MFSAFRILCCLAEKVLLAIILLMVFIAGILQALYSWLRWYVAFDFVHRCSLLTTLTSQVIEVALVSVAGETMMNDTVV